MNEDQFIKEAFQEYKAKFENVYNFQNFEEKHESIHYFLYDEILIVNREIINAIAKLPQGSRLVAAELSDWIEILSKEAELKKGSANPIKRKIANHVSDLLENLQELRIKMPEQTQGSGISASKKRVMVNSINKPVINRNQVLLLMHMLKTHGLIIKDIEGRAMAECFSVLTGFQPEQLRKSYSDFKNDDIDISQVQVNELKDVLIKICEDITRKYNKNK